MDEVFAMDQDGDGQISHVELCNSYIRVANKIHEQSQDILHEKKEKKLLSWMLAILVVVVAFVTMANYATSTAAVRKAKDMAVEGGSTVLVTTDHEAVSTNMNEVQSPLPALAWLPNSIREHVKTITFTGQDNEGIVVYHKEVSSIVTHEEKSTTVKTSDGDTLSWNINNMENVMIELADGKMWSKPAGCEQCTVINVVQTQEVSEALDKFHEAVGMVLHERGRVLSVDTCTDETSGSYQCVDLFDGIFWADLSDSARAAAKTLGWDQGVWDLGGITSFNQLFWSEMIDEEKDASRTLGCDEQCWANCPFNTTTNIFGGRALSTSCVDLFAHVYWADLTAAQSQAATTLGWDQVNWDTGGYTGFEGYAWSDLTPEQQAASISLDQCDEQCWATCRNNCANSYNGTYWLDLMDSQQEAATALGYSQGVWDLGGYSSFTAYEWSDMTSVQHDAAMTLYHCDEQCWGTACR